MNVAFFGQTGPYSGTALRRLLHRGDAPYRVSLVVEGMRGSLPLRRKHRRHVPGRHLIGKSAAAPDTDDLAQTALAVGLEVLQTCSVNDPFVVGTHVRRGIDTLVCAGFPSLFGATLLSCATRGALNAHPSLLPRWRGPSPIFWALRAGDTRLGVTVHLIDPLEDHGPVVARQPFALLPKQSGRAIYERAGLVAGALLHEALEKLARNTLVAIPQQHDAATRAPRPKAEDAFVTPATWNCGHLVDFASGAAFFRAPWMVLGGDTYHVREGVQACLGGGLPGEYVVHGDTLLVPCRDGTARLRVQV